MAKVTIYEKINRRGNVSLVGEFDLSIIPRIGETVTVEGCHYKVHNVTHNTHSRLIILDVEKF